MAVGGGNGTVNKMIFRYSMIITNHRYTERTQKKLVTPDLILSGYGEVSVDARIVPYPFSELNHLVTPFDIEDGGLSFKEPYVFLGGVALKYAPRNMSGLDAFKKFQQYIEDLWDENFPEGEEPLRFKRSRLTSNDRNKFDILNLGKEKKRALKAHGNRSLGVLLPEQRYVTRVWDKKSRRCGKKPQPKTRNMGSI